MRAAIIPPEKLGLFDRALSPDMPFLQVGPVPIHSGPVAGSYAINEAILDSCPEWRAAAEAAMEYMAGYGVAIEEIDPADLRNPEVPPYL